MISAAFGGLEGDSGLETFRTKQMIPIFRFCCRRQNEEFVTGIVQTIDEPAGGAAGMRASADLDQTFFHPHGHPLIENETFPLPMFVSELLLVGRNSPVKLKDLFESLVSQQR
jgi:hypothetical protein